MVILFSAIFSTITLIDDRASGFLQVILVGPGSRAALVIGKILGVMTIASIQALLFLCVAPFAGIGLHHIDFILLIAFIVLGSAATAGIGFVFAWGTQSSAAYHALMSVILIPLWILSGAMFPPSVRWIEAIVQVNPLGWMVAGFRAAFSNGVAPFGTVNPNLTAQMSLIYLLIFCIVIIGIGVYLCQRRK